MTKKKNSGTEGCGCLPMGCCKIDAVLSIDERGQMVLPKDIRDKAGLKAGDKLAVVNWEQEGRTACMILIKTENLAEMVKGFLGPVFKDVFKA
jgi:AbrB family looped-hinge helix DNA binding protein